MRLAQSDCGLLNYASPVPMRQDSGCGRGSIASGVFPCSHPPTLGVTGRLTVDKLRDSPYTRAYPASGGRP